MTTAGFFHPSVCPHDCPSVCALEVERTGDGRLGKVRGSGRNPYTAGGARHRVARRRAREVPASNCVVTGTPAVLA